jgi:hypothetical protein
VQTFLPSTSSSPQAPKLFLVHHKSSPSCLLIKSSRTIAGVRAPAAAAGPPPTSSPLRRSSTPGDLPSIFPRPHGSSQCSTLLSTAPFLTAVRAPAVAPPLRRAPPLAGDFPGRSSSTNQSRVSPIAFPRRLFACPCPTSPPACSPSPSGPRGGTKGLIVKVLKLLGS